MRRLVTILIVLGVLGGIAETALARPDAPCVCQRWAQQFQRDPGAQRVFDRQVMFYMSARQRDRTKKQVYNYADRGDFDEGFCKRHPKICRAALACVIAGGGAYQAARQSGASRKASGRAGAWACAAAAATVMVTG
jgi:hypothetical protein